MVLTKMKKTSVSYHHHHKITYFSDCWYYEDTCRVAGFNVTEIINEPTVNRYCLWFGQDIEAQQSILIFDLESSSFMCSSLLIRLKYLKSNLQLGTFLSGQANALFHHQVPVQASKDIIETKCTACEHAKILK